MPTLSCGHDTDDFESCPTCMMRSLHSQLKEAQEDYEASQAARARLAAALEWALEKAGTRGTFGDVIMTTGEKISDYKVKLFNARDALQADDRAAAELWRALEREHEAYQEHFDEGALKNCDCKLCTAHRAVEAARKGIQA